LEEPKLFEDAKILVGFHALEKRWLSEASVSAGKLILNWLIELLGVGKEEQNLIDYNVSKTPPSSEDLLIIPHLQGARAPWWAAYSKGTIYGLTLKHTKWYIIRAFMESVAYEIKLVLEIFNRNGIKPSKIVCLEKMENLKTWHIIKSSCINFPYTFINLEEPISYGAALISMIGTGRKDLFKYWIENRTENKIEPQKELVKIYERMLNKYVKAVKSTLRYYK
ncbi:MAG: hypothetical protein H5T50_09045, partial [Nitrososphaeria archaeon]|nr:hypothetical protein [Nitrososphaeria archaeon]